MANTLSKDGITTGQTVETWHVTQSIDAFTATEAYDISISGSLNVTEGTVAFGDGFNCNIDYSTLAIGKSTNATGANSFAAGGTSWAIGAYSHAEGGSTFTGVSDGYTSDSITSGIVTLNSNYGDLSGDYNDENYLYINDSAYEDNYTTLATMISSSSFDGTNTIIYLYDTSITTGQSIVGNLTNGISSWLGGGIAGSSFSHTEGEGTYALGVTSHAEGAGSIAIGQYSHAEGENTGTIGISSHSEGISTVTVGNGSHSEGLGTISSGSYSHAEGKNTIAIGASSHAEGEGAKSMGNASHAEGLNTMALGNYSHTEGTGTIASGSSQTVVGSYNTQGDITSLFIVGSGANTGNRRDAFKVTKNSSITIPTTQSTAPTWSGSNGEIIPVTTGSRYFLYMWMNGAWRRSEFT